MNDIRVGFGEDIHAFRKGRDLVLCGVKIDCPFGLDGHSDADAPLHALSDAILGALALGDIGKYFPPSEASIEGISSSLIVKKCLSLAKEKGYKMHNVDISITTEFPHLGEHILEMRQSVAAILGLPLDSVSVKAMTNEGFDAVGGKKALKASAIVSLIGDNHE